MEAELLVLNRLAGIITSGPSFMTGVNILNSVLSAYKGTALQKAVIVSTIVSLATDVLCVMPLAAWFIDNTITWFTLASFVFSVCKRTHSVVTVHVTFMRFQAVTGKARASSVAPFIYTAFYVVLSALTVLTQLVAFQQNKWDSAATRNSDMYRYGYKLVNLITCAYYVVFGLYVDYLFINLGGQNPLGRERFRRLRMFYNHWIYLSYEAILFCVVLITVIWNAFDPNIVATSYVEQCLLSFMMLNGISLVQAVSSINSSTAETTNDDSAMPVSVAGPPTKMMAAIPSPTGIAPSAYAYSQQNPQQQQQQQYPAQSAMPMSPASSSGSTAAGYGPASGYGAAAAAYPPQNNNGGYGAYSAPPQAGGMQAGRGGGGGGGYGGANYF